MLEMKAVQKSFKKKMVLKGIDCEIGEGVYGLLGPNGAGKTTLMRCIVGLYSLQGGQILFDGKDVAKNGDLLARIGYLPQKFGLFKELKVYNMMEYFATLKNIPKEEQRPAIEKSLEIVNLSERMGDRVGALSGGMIRRLGIAQAVLGEPEVILFDEPTAGLDPEERMRFKNIIASIKKGRTILIDVYKRQVQLLLRDAVDDEVKPLFRQPFADGGADPAGAAGDQRQGALILVFHSQNPRFFWMIGLSTRPADWRWETGPPRAIPGGKTSFYFTIKLTEAVPVARKDAKKIYISRQPRRREKCFD